MVSGKSLCRLLFGILFATGEHFDLESGVIFTANWKLQVCQKWSLVGRYPHERATCVCVAFQWAVHPFARVGSKVLVVLFFKRTCLPLKRKARLFWHSAFGIKAVCIAPSFCVEFNTGNVWMICHGRNKILVRSYACVVAHLYTLSKIHLTWWGPGLFEVPQDDWPVDSLLCCIFICTECETQKEIICSAHTCVSYSWHWICIIRSYFLFSRIFMSTAVRWFRGLNVDKLYIDGFTQFDDM